MAQRKAPEKMFRIGFVSASVFAHEVESDETKRTIRSVSVQKRYLDEGEPKYTSSFNLSELPQAIRALQLAQLYVEVREADVPLGEGSSFPATDRAEHAVGQSFPFRDSSLGWRKEVADGRVIPES